MEERAFLQFNGIGIRKKRTQISRRPKPDEVYSPSSNTVSDGVSKDSSDENGGANFTRKEFNINQCMSRDIGNGKQYSEGALAPTNWKGTSRVLDSDSRSGSDYGGVNGEGNGFDELTAGFDVLESENKVKKLKLKVNGVTRMIHADSPTNVVSSMNNGQSSETSSSWQKRNLQGITEGNSRIISDKRTGLRGIPWKDFAKGGFSIGKEDFSMGKTSVKGSMGKQVDKSEASRKSKRVRKRRAVDEEFGEDDEDDEIRYLEKLRTSKVAVGYKDDEEFSKKQRRLSTMESNGALRLSKDEKRKSRPDRAREDADYEEEEHASDSKRLEGIKKQKKESVESLMEGKREVTLTTRQRALLSSKHGIPAPESNAIEFPNGLPPAQSKKPKEQLTEVEQQLKRAEALKRRRMQVEKANRESEAEAIRKILGQDSSRKKREEKKKKRQEELAQERAANAKILGSNTIRCVLSPTGTVLTFSEDMGLPSIFNPKPHSYPPPREKCAGPSCTNPYKYRDSKTKLPLCSLQCYKAVQGKMPTESSY